jgi:putative DNA primase/helicase
MMNGRDRGRAKGDGTAAKSPPFRGVFLSNGEFDYPTFFANAKIRISPGQLVRFLNIPAHAHRDHGMFTDLHGHANGADFANMLKENTSRYHGTVLPEFIRFIAEKQDSIPATAKAMITKYVKKLKRALPKGYQVTGREERVIGCFALMACAGELAIAEGVLNWDAGEAFAGVRACFRAWAKHDRKIAPLTDDDVFAHIRRFFRSGAEGKFVAVSDYDNSHQLPEAGFIRTVDGTLAYLVIPKYFESVVCQRFGKAAGIRVLVVRNLLVLGAEGRPRKQVQMPDNCGGGKQNFYVVRASIAE